MVKVLLFDSNTVTDVEALGQALILKNIAFGYLEEKSNQEDSQLDENIERMEALNKSLAYEDNVSEAIRILNEKLSTLTTANLSELNKIKPFKEGLLDFTQMDFSINDLKNPDNFSKIIGKGEETSEYERLTASGSVDGPSDADVIIENMEEILEEESDEYPFKTLVDTMKNNMEVTRGRGKIVISFGDEEKKTLTEQVLVNYGPSNLFRVDYPKTKATITKQDEPLLESHYSEETKWRRVNDPKGKTFLEAHGLDKKLEMDINGFNLMDIYDVEVDTSQQKTSVKRGEERMTLFSEARVILSLKDLDKNTAFKLLMHCLFPKETGGERRKIIDVLSDFKKMVEVKVIVPEEVILDPYKNEFRKDVFFFDPIFSQLEVEVKGELRFTKIPILTEGRGNYAEGRRVSRNIPKYFKISEIDGEEDAAKTGSYTEQVGKTREEAIDFLQNLLANTYELEEALEG
jgi:hypothetical protein